MNGKRWLRAMILGVMAAFGAAITCAQLQARPMMMNPGHVGANGTVNLPYLVQDASGNQWRIYQNGWLQQQGNNVPLYSQGATLMINNVQPQQQNNMARVDEKTGEVIIENLNANGFTITRRILIDKAGSFARYVDIIKNNGGADADLSVMIQTNSNYGIQNAQMIADPKKKDQNIGWVGQTGAGPCLVEMFCGKNSKVPVNINWPQGNSYVQATMQVKVPGGKEVALMHLHTIAAGQDAGSAWINNLKDNQLIRSIPAPLRRLIVNFPVGQSFIGDIEILRGDLLDVVELRGGDQYKGTLKEKTFDLQAFYGAVSLPVDKVIGLINVGQFRPRQLIVTGDGQIFGGKLKKETVDLQLSNGQVTQIPLSQITRVGYRKRPDEGQGEWPLNKPMVQMRSGERVNVQLPAGPIEVVTRYGRLSLQPNLIGAVLLQNEDSSVHEIHLTDGSKFAGLLAAPEFEMRLETGATDAPVKFPTSTIARLQLNAKVSEPDDMAPTLKLANEDLLVGTLSGMLKIDTAFDTITVNAAEIHSMTHAAPAGLDVQITLWDGTTLSGQLEDQDLPCQLAGGVTLRVPVPLLVEYAQPQPQPSPAMVQKINDVIKQLNAEDWHERDRAQAQLLSMGPVASSVLKKLRENQPPEAQQRIDTVLRELEKQRHGKSGAPGAGPAAPIIDVEN